MAIGSFIHYAGLKDISLLATEIEVKKVNKRKTQHKVVDFLSERALQTLLDVPDISSKVGQRNRFLSLTWTEIVGDSLYDYFAGIGIYHVVLVISARRTGGDNIE